MNLERTAEKEEVYAPEIPRPQYPLGYGRADSAQQKRLAQEREAVLKRCPNRSVPVSERYPVIQRLRNQLKNPYTGDPRTREYFTLKDTRDRLPMCQPANMMKCIEGLQERVFILSSGTGSGKTTELPPLILDDMLARDNEPLQRIGITQPRRDTARNMSARVARALDTWPGEWVGHHFRLEKSLGEHTVIRYLTDGLLLEEALRDRHALRKKYGVIVVDEAHERTSAIDQLMALLADELRRPESTLRVVIMSATMDANIFERYFREFAPSVLNIETQNPFARTIRHLPEGVPDPSPSQVNDHIFDAVANEVRHGHDVLVFVAGEPDIETLAQRFGSRDHGLSVAAGHVPWRLMKLFGNQKPDETSQVYQSEKTSRVRVILATNMAETGVTVPQLDTVIDAGFCKVASRNFVAHADRLAMEAICKSSADQRAGRVARDQAGLCIRLYTQAKYDSMPEQLPPDITRKRMTADALRLYRAAPGLRMNDLGLLTPLPDDSEVEADGELHLLGLITAQRAAEPVGTHVADLGCDPPVGLMLLTAVHMSLEARRWAVCTAAALELRDPSVVLKMSRLTEAWAAWEHRQGDIRALGNIVSNELLDAQLEARPRPGWARAYWNPVAVKQLATLARSLDSKLDRVHVHLHPDKSLWRSDRDFDGQVEQIVAAGLKLQFAEATGEADDEYIDQATKQVVKLDRKSVLYSKNLRQAREIVQRQLKEQLSQNQDAREFVNASFSNYEYVWYSKKQEYVREGGDSSYVISRILQASRTEIHRHHPNFVWRPSGYLAPAFAPQRRQS